MGTRVLAMLAVAGAAIVVLAGIAYAGAWGGGGINHRMTIHVVEHPVTDQVIDIGAPGDSPGDQLPFANPVYNATNKHKVGSDQGNCVRASAVQGRWECMWTTFLRGGQITVEGPFLDAVATTKLAVTGGTGRFANVRGQMLLHTRSDGNYDFVFELQP
jgi:hypothetical protein